MTGPIKVRRFIPADSKSVSEIEEASSKYLTPMLQLSRFYEIITEGFLVAEIENKVVGYVIGNLIDESEGHILAIATAPKYRRRGVGTALLHAVVAALKDKGAKKVRLELKLNNTDARKFYSGLGFKELQIARNYYEMRGYTEDALIMAKEVS